MTKTIVITEEWQMHFVNVLLSSKLSGRTQATMIELLPTKSALNLVVDLLKESPVKTQLLKILGVDVSWHADFRKLIETVSITEELKEILLTEEDDREVQELLTFLNILSPSPGIERLLKFFE